MKHFTSKGSTSYGFELVYACSRFIRSLSRTWSHPTRLATPNAPPYDTFSENHGPIYLFYQDTAAGDVADMGYDWMKSHAVSLSLFHTL
jgi:hypothetical protein